MLEPQTAEALLAIEDLHTGYGATEILRGVDLDVRSGEIVTVLGANGVGKSTLSRTVSGVMRPWRGRARRSNNRDRVFAWFPRLAERQLQRAGTLSGGEQQMLAIGRGLMAEPELLILDEPSLGLSPLLVEELFALIKAINADGIALLLIEQNVVQSLEVAQRAYILDNGRFVIEGLAAEIGQNPKLKRAYLGM